MLFTLAMNNNSDKFQKHPPAMGEIRLNRLYLRVCLHTHVCEREEEKRKNREIEKPGVCESNGDPRNGWERWENVNICSNRCTGDVKCVGKRTSFCQVLAWARVTHVCPV